jgi:NO-binding membrane sensor protein with MHYT domain
MTMNGLSGMDINDANAVAVYYETHAIPQRFDAGIIVASIVVAIMGAYASLYLLGRRTSNSGKRNIVLLISAATTMAFVGIWSMHFIGMYMRLEATPYISWYIRYNPGFAAFSFIAPAIALIVSFLFLDHDTDGFRFWKAILAGTLTGCTVALMHYSASFYCNFNVTFAPAQVVGSILLACVLCIVGFTAFFRFRYQWQDSWWKRGACAMCIGMGVSGMHYVGVSGTSYKVKTKDIQGWDLTTGKRRNLILVCVIAGEFIFSSPSIKA